MRYIIIYNFICKLHFWWRKKFILHSWIIINSIFFCYVESKCYCVVISFFSLKFSNYKISSLSWKCWTCRSWIRKNHQNRRFFWLNFMIFYFLLFHLCDFTVYFWIYLKNNLIWFCIPLKILKKIYLKIGFDWSILHAHSQQKNSKRHIVHIYSFSRYCQPIKKTNQNVRDEANVDKYLVVETMQGEERSKRIILPPNP